MENIKRKNERETTIKSLRVTILLRTAGVTKHKANLERNPDHQLLRAKRKSVVNMRARIVKYSVDSATLHDWVFSVQLRSNRRELYHVRRVGVQGKETFICASERLRNEAR